MPNTPNYNLILYALGASNWHTGVNGNFELIDNLLKVLSDALAGKAASSHNHNSLYAALAHNHTGTYAPASHSHSLNDISDLARLFAGISNIPEIAISGLPANDHIVQVIISHESQNPLRIYALTAIWGTGENIIRQEYKSLSNTILLPKPPADSTVWVNGIAQLSLTAVVQHATSGTLSPNATSNAQVYKPSYITVQDVINGIKNETALKSEIIQGVAQEIVLQGQFAQPSSS